MVRNQIKCPITYTIFTYTESSTRLDKIFESFHTYTSCEQARRNWEKQEKRLPLAKVAGGEGVGLDLYKSD